MAPSPKPAEQGWCEWALGGMQWQIVRICEANIDDLLWAGENETLRKHREGNGTLLLCRKALMSQTSTLVLLVALAMFVKYQCIFATITVISVVWSLSVFPHVHPKFWQCLQVWNIVIIAVKMLYLSPLFCQNGNLVFSGCSAGSGAAADAAAPASQVSLQSVLGMLKLQTSDDPNSKFVFTNLWDALFMEVLMAAMLFLHCHMLSQGGRFQASPEQIRQKLREKDREKAHATFGRSSSKAVEERGDRDAAPADAAATELQEDLDSATPSRAPRASALSLATESEGSFLQTLMDILLGSALMKKPAKDFYFIRLVLATGCFVFLLVFWNKLTGSTTNFIDAAIKSSLFSGTQVIFIVLFLAMMVADRMLHTLATQDRTAENGAARGQHLRPELPPRQPSGIRRMSSVGTIPNDESWLVQQGRANGGGQWQWQDIKVIIAVSANVLIFTQLLTLHAVYISVWASAQRPAETGVSMFCNPWLIFFYFLYMLFLSLSARQLAFDVHVGRGGLGLTHNTDLGSRLLFKVFSAVPFIEELRVLTDWTVTRTSMDFFMWMKLEDAHNNLYRTRCDMEFRKARQKAEPRSKCEKVCQGGLLLLVLFVLIVGPLMIFSTLNSWVAQPVSINRATLRVSLRVLSNGNQLSLYESTQPVIKPFPSISSAQLVRDWPFTSTPPQDLTFKNVTFNNYSDNVWTVSQPLILTTIESLKHSNASLVVEYLFQADQQSMPGSQTIPLNATQIFTLMSILMAATNQTSNPHGSIVVGSLLLANVLQTHIYIDSSLNVSSSARKYGLSLTVQVPPSTAPQFPQWSVALLPSEQNIEFAVLTEKSTKGLSGGSGSSSSFNIVGLYITVVYTIGSFLKLQFQDASKRVIYDEIPDTAVLEDLCNGVYIARLTGDLETEETFYYELIRIYRSPELLMDITKRRDTRPGDYRGGRRRAGTPGDGASDGEHSPGREGSFASFTIPRSRSRSDASKELMRYRGSGAKRE